MINLSNILLQLSDCDIFILITIVITRNYYTSTKSWRSYIFTAVCLCVCLCVCVYVSVRIFLWTKLQPNGCTDLDAVFAKWLLPSLAQTQLNLVTLGLRSRSQWRITHFSSQFSVNFPSLYFSSLVSDQSEIRYVA